MTRYLKQILIALDQLVNSLFCGNARETISGRAYRKRNLKHYRIIIRILDALFFWQKDHCRRSHEAEICPQRDENK